ncbi:AAA family ATPase [Thermococcus sp.]
MIIAVTGTPGVGKTTVSELLAQKLGYEYVSIKKLAEKKDLGEKIEDEIEIDIEKLAEVVREEFKEKNIILDSHLSHLLPVDLVVVLRLNPELLLKRLLKRGYMKDKLSENLEAELVDVCLIEAIEEHENVIEVDTTGKTPEEVAEEIVTLMEKGIKKRVGIVDWSESYEKIMPHLRR